MFRTPRALSIATVAAVALSAAGCTSTYERALAYTGPEYRLTSAELRPKLETARDVQETLLRYPIGTSYRGRRCGNTVGLSKNVLNVATGSTTNREPMASSAPIFTDYILASLTAPGRTVERQARQASIRHDYCYLHGKGTYGLSRSQCDRDLGADMRRICHAANSRTETVTCLARVELVEAAVSAFGFLAYSDNQHETCEYDGQLAPARDFVVTGSFEVAAGRHQTMLIEATPQSADVLKVTRRDLAGAEATGLLDVREITLYAQQNMRRELTHRPVAPSLASIGVQAQDLLVYTPQVADIDGDGSDEAVLIGMDRPDGDSEASFGIFMVPVDFDSSGVKPAKAAYMIDSRRLRRSGGEVTDDFFKLDRKRLLHEVEAFEHSILIGEYDGAGGRELILPSLGVFGAETSAEQDHADIRIFQFDADLRLDTTWLLMTETFTRSPFQSQCKNLLGQTEGPQPEIYKRFQYRPMFLNPRSGAAGELVFLYRDKCQDLWRYKLPWQATLIANRIEFGDLSRRWGRRARAASDAPAPPEAPAGTPTATVQPPPEAKTSFLFPRWGRFAYPILELQRCGASGCDSKQRSTDWAALSLCNADGPRDKPENCYDEVAGDVALKPRPEDLILTMNYDIEGALAKTDPCRTEYFGDPGSAPDSFDNMVCVRRSEYVLEAPEDFGLGGSEITDKGGKPLRFNQMTSAFLERGSIVAHAGSDGSEGVAMLWPAGGLWRLLMVQAPGPGILPMAVEHICDTPVSFAQNDVRRAPLLAVSAGGVEKRDAIVAVRRAAPNETTTAQGIVANGFVYAGLRPDGDTYRTIGGSRCRVARKWKVRDRLRPAEAQGS